MRQISNYTGQISKGNFQAPVATKAKTKEQRSRLDETMSKLLSALKLSYPAWKQAWVDDKQADDAMELWKSAFKESEITIRMVDTGIKKAMMDTSDFIPSVGKFISWCKVNPENFGMPSAEAAYREATVQAGMIMAQQPSVYSHLAVKVAARKTGNHFLASQPQHQTKPIFIEIYQTIVADVMAGKDIDPKPEGYNENQVEHQAKDKNLAHYEHLQGIDQKYADDFLETCKQAGVILDVVDQTVSNSFADSAESLSDLVDSEVEPEKTMESVEAKPLVTGIKYNELELKMISKFKSMDTNALKNAESGFYDSMMNDPDPEERRQSARLMGLVKEQMETNRKQYKEKERSRA